MKDNQATGTGFYVSELPTVGQAADLYESLAVEPDWHPTERQLPPNLRRTGVVRLSSYFKPGARHLAFAEGFLLFLHGGYEGRGRVLADHQRRIREFGAQHAAGLLLDSQKTAQGSDGEEGHPKVHMTQKMIGTRNTAGSAVLIGTAGMGKTLTVEEILNGIPELIEHTTPMSLKQVVWLKLDCPHKGSVRALCFDFFTEMDRILGTTYLKTYAGLRATEESMMSHMALVANLHALGVLVIDEIQHLGRVREDHDVLLKFLVTLINKIGVPVLLIGTNAASDIVRKTLRLGRRSVGLGSATWERYGPDEEDWKDFVADLWRYQWTDVETPLDDILRTTLYEQSAGIVDIAVKLFMLAQLRAIRRGEGGGSECISPALIRSVARDDLAIIRPLVEALNSGDRRRIERYGDMAPLRDVFTKILQTETGNANLALPQSKPGHRGTRADEVEDESTEGGLLRSVFRQLGIADDIGRQLVDEAKADRPDADVWEIMEMVRERLKVSPARKPPTSKSKRDRPVETYVDGDLRGIVAAGSAEGVSSYRALLHAGLAGPGALLRAL